MSLDNYAIAPEEVDNLATLFKTKADLYEQFVDEIYNKVHDLENYWLGTEAQQYVSKVDECKTSINKMISKYGDFRTAFSRVSEISSDAIDQIKSSNSGITGPQA